jgi:putative NADPH-quinone reductase
MRYLLVDGHVETGRLSGALLDHYADALGPGATVERLAMADLAFAPPETGYRVIQRWEPDLRRAAGAIAAADHLVVAFPLWWGGEPSRLKAFLERVLLPGFAYRFQDKGPWWDRYLAGRSADVIITMDTPAWYLRLAYWNAPVARWRGQVLGFCGYRPVRFHLLGPVRGGDAERSITAWRTRIAAAARSAAGLRRQPRSTVPERYLAELDAAAPAPMASG